MLQINPTTTAENTQGRKITVRWNALARTRPEESRDANKKAMPICPTALMTVSRMLLRKESQNTPSLKSSA